MKIVEIKDNYVHYEFDYSNLEEARSKFSNQIRIEEAPNWAFVGCKFDGSKEGDDRYIIPPAPEGFAYIDGNLIDLEYMRSLEREQKHAETTNDTMQALRKIREGDNSAYWSKWLDMLDAYNVAIEETKNQKDYPLKVVYPEYPTKPTK